MRLPDGPCRYPDAWYPCLMEGTSSQAMNSPLTYPDQRRDDNLVEFFLKLIGAILKKVLRALLVWLFDVLP